MEGKVQSCVFPHSQQGALQAQAAPRPLPRTLWSLGPSWYRRPSSQAEGPGFAGGAGFGIPPRTTGSEPGLVFSLLTPAVPPPPSAAFPDNPSILSDLCSTLSRLAVRNEFCQEVVDLGGLSVLVALLGDCSDHQVGVQSCLRV